MHFALQMQNQGVTILNVNADHVEFYKRALLEDGLPPGLLTLS